MAVVTAIALYEFIIRNHQLAKDVAAKLGEPRDWEQHAEPLPEGWGTQPDFPVSLVVVYRDANIRLADKLN
jgi:hypothetical protein